MKVYTVFMVSRVDHINEATIKVLAESEYLAETQALNMMVNPIVWRVVEIQEIE